jgi:hypothetical protein
VEKPLTAKQEAFAQAVADGMAKSDAYRLAYNAGNMSNEVITVKANEVANNGKVAVAIASKKAKLEAKELWRREDSVLFYREMVRSEEKAADRIKACERLDKMHGFEAPQQVEFKGMGEIRLNIVRGGS